MSLHSWIGAFVVLAVWPDGLRAQNAAEDFSQSCAMCHSIGGGPLAGPDLAGMSGRRERAWLIRFIVDPQAVVDSGDATAKAMVDEYQGMIMPASPGMTHERAAALVDYVREQSSEGDEPAPTQAPESQPLTAGDVERGRDLFLGTHPLEAGGAACLACHRVQGLDALGGGALGPDLTRIYERFGGRHGLESWLASPPTPLMNTLYRTRPLSEKEIADLTTFFEESASGEAVPQPTQRSAFFLLGALGTGLLLGLFHLLWRERRRGIRAKLVRNYRLRGVP